MNEQAEAWLRELQPTTAIGGHPDAVLPTEIHTVSARARAIAMGLERGSHARIQTRTGRWLIVHGFSLRDSEGGKARAALIIEPARASQVALLIVEAYNLTPREQEGGSRGGSGGPDSGAEQAEEHGDAPSENPSGGNGGNGNAGCQRLAHGALAQLKQPRPPTHEGPPGSDSSTTRQPTRPWSRRADPHAGAWNSGVLLPVPFASAPPPRSARAVPVERDLHDAPSKENEEEPFPAPLTLPPPIYA